MADDNVNVTEEAVVEETAQHDSSVTTGSDSATAPKEVAADEPFDIDSLIADERDDEEDTSKAETPEEEKAVEQPDTEEVAAEETPVEQPPGEEEPPQQVEQSPQAEASQTPEEINKAYRDFFDKSVDVLEKHVYAFDEQTSEELDTNPSKVIPKLAAQLHMQVLSAAMTQMNNLFPMLLQEHQSKSNAYTQAEEEFYTQYPALRQHKDTVNRIAQVYRAANPKERDRKKMASEIAAMAMVNARIPLTNIQTEPSAQKPVTPTSARGGTTSTAAAPKPSAWDELIQDED